MQAPIPALTDARRQMRYKLLKALYHTYFADSAKDLLRLNEAERHRQVVS